MDPKSLIGIIGLGYVGLPPFLEHASLNIDVIGFEIDQQKLP